MAVIKVSSRDINRRSRRLSRVPWRSVSKLKLIFIWVKFSIKTTLGRWYCGHSIKKWLVVSLRPHVHRGLSIIPYVHCKNMVVKFTAFHSDSGQDNIKFPFANVIV